MSPLTLTEPQRQALLQAARAAQRMAYAPYSRYPVGAADTTRPLDARVRAALEAREWFREAAARCQARGPADTFSRLRPSMAW